MRLSGICGALLFVFALEAGAETPARTLIFPDNLRGTQDAGALLEFARRCEDEGAFDLAAEALVQAVALRPEELALRVRLAENRYRMGAAGKSDAFDEAGLVLAEESASAELKARAGMVRALIQLEQGLWGPAGEGFQEVLAAQPDHTRAAIGLAAVETARGDIGAASARLDGLGAAAQPFDAETRYLLRVALQSFQSERRTFADAADNHAAYGKLLYRAGRLPEAVLALRRAATQRGNDTATWNLVAAIGAQLGDAAATRAACEASLAINPEQPEIAKLLDSVSKPQ
jgi:Flp pilus assembly protein TadD